VGNPASVEVSVGNQTSSANVLLPGTYEGGQALRPALAPAPTKIPLFDNEVVLLLAMGLVLVAAAGAAYAIASTMIKDDLSNVLQPYAGAMGDDVDDGENALQRSALMQRAVAITEQVAENQGMLTRAEVALERANLPLRAGEALVFYALIVIGVTVVALVFSRNVVAGLVFGIVAALAPPAIVNFIASSRRKKFMAQLPDTLSLLSGTLRAGYSLMQGVEAVSQEVDEPMGVELRRVVTEARLGRPLEESLESSADRMDSPDFAWAVMAIRIQREVGGNLAELLMTVADTMVQRERLRRDVRTLTAEGRVSAYVLAGLPFGLALIMYLLNPDYTGELFTDTLGIIMLVMAGVSMLVGFLWMRKIINIEI
jgi:tight adherence protein B